MLPRMNTRSDPKAIPVRVELIYRILWFIPGAEADRELQLRHHSAEAGSLPARPVCRLLSHPEPRQSSASLD